MTKKNLSDVTKDLKLDEKEAPISAVDVAEYSDMLRANLLELEVAEQERLHVRTEELHDLEMSERPIHLALAAIETLADLRSTICPSAMVTDSRINETLVQAIDAKLIELIGLIDIESDTVEQE